MIPLAAWCAGFGGLLLELAFARRHGLILGLTAEATALALAVFLLGLGLGGLLVPRLPKAGRSAARLYIAVAAASLAGDWLLRDQGSAAWQTGIGWVILFPGIPALLMGAAFPLLLEPVRPSPARTGWVCGCSLAGSVAGAWLAGNELIPRLGVTPTVSLGALAYLVAGLLLAARRSPVPRIARRLPLGLGALPMLGAGAGVLGLEVLLLRRLPFWLEGFAPTLSGVVAACLLAMTLGAVLGAPLLARLFGRRAATWALVFGGVWIAAGLHERAVPWIARWPVDSDLGLHTRIIAAALAAAGPACVCLGAVPTLLLARLRQPATRAALAGQLFFWQGVGGVAGVLGVGELLPRLAPGTFFQWAPACAGALAVLPILRTGGWLARVGLAAIVAAAALGLSGAGTPWQPKPPIEGARYYYPGSYRPKAHCTDNGVTASVVYDRRHHSQLLFTDGFRAAETGPGTAYMRALGHLPLLLRQDLERVAVIALGTGTTAAAVTQWSEPTSIAVVEISPAVLALAPWFGTDGPLGAGRQPPPWQRDPRVKVHAEDGRRFLAQAKVASLDLITIEPLLPYAPGTAPLYSAEFYAIARRALSPRGLLVQWLPTHALPRETFDTLLATLARTFPQVSVWLFDQSTIVIGSAAPHLTSPAELDRRFASLDHDLRVELHQTGLATTADVVAAFVGDAVAGACGEAPSLHDDRPFLEAIGYWSGRRKLQFYPDNLQRLVDVVRGSQDGVLTDRVLRRVRESRLLGLQLLAQTPLAAGAAMPQQATQALGLARDQLPESVLLHREETLARRAWLEREAIDRQGQGMGEAAGRHLVRDPRAALLRAVAALESSLTPRQRQSMVAAALAVDPGLLDDPLPFLAGLRADAPGRGPAPLEELGELPAGQELVALAARDDPTAVAVQAVFGVRVASALLAELAKAPLSLAAHAALRVTVDPVLLAQAAAAIEARRGDLQLELVPLWRPDLPMPASLVAWGQGDAAQRIALAHVLADHRDRRATAALAKLLLDPDTDVRYAAAVTLFDLWENRVPYDPEWDEPQRRRAAQQLLDLHNPDHDH